MADPGAAPRRLPLLLRRAWYGLNQAFRRRIAHLEITPDQYTVLRTLHEFPAAGLRQRELTDAICSDPNTVASLLDRMETARLIERVPHHEDRRALSVRLQALGREKFAAAREVAAVLQNEVLDCLPEPSRAAFLAQLAIVADACHTAAQGSPRRES